MSHLICALTPLLVLAALSTACERDSSLGQLNAASAQPKVKDPPKPPAASDAPAPKTRPEQSTPTSVAKTTSESAAEDASVVTKPKRPKNAKVRTIEPISASRGACLEMVSFCSGQPRRCTSSPIHVPCGEEVEVKSRKEWLRCECP